MTGRRSWTVGVLCIAEEFLLSQYSDYAYYKLEECIERFAQQAAHGGLRNPPGWLHMALEQCRHEAENEEGGACT